MLYTLLAFLFAIFAVLLIHGAITMLLAASWFMGWLRGMFGLSLLFIAVTVALLALDIYSYKPVVVDQQVATVSFEEIEPQHFTAVVVARNGKEQRFSLRGDQWQLDARVIKWEGLLSALNIRPAFRLDRLSGRFYDIQKETTESRTTYSLSNSILGVDIWRVLNDNDKLVSMVDTNSVAPPYLPMKKNALYEISLSSKSAVAVRPLNAVAEQAIAEWH